jgi:adenosylhomocysteine nucleosidase
MSDDTIAVICAMESEAVHLRRRLGETRDAPLARWRRTQGPIGDVPVELVVAGIGLINAAAATTALLTLQRPRAVLNYGCSGAHRDDINPGDIVIADQVVHVSAQIVLPDGARRYMGFDYSVDATRVQEETIRSDPELLDRALRIAEQTTLPPWPGSDQPPRIHVGTVASADVWTQHGESIRTLHDLHRSLCEEMEAAAIAQVCAIFGVPFLAVKDISNNELLNATANREGLRWPTLLELEHELGLRAALVVEAVIDAQGRET